jgi:predicted metal-dependent hydrolase
MTRLVVRRLLVDLEAPVARHWNGGDAFRTAFFNALSLSFPLGEQFFVDSVRDGAKQLAPHDAARFGDEVRGFMGQEATHRRVHALFNAHLERQGLVNHWERRIRRRLRLLDGVDVRAWLAVTAAAEHFTAILAEHLLSHPRALAGAEPRLAAMWLWHASEESEHRSTAFDLYRALAGTEKRRLRLFRLVTFNFATDLLRQTMHNLWRDGTLFERRTWASGWRFLFAPGGVVRDCYRPWRRYFRGDFHPDQLRTPRAEEWLRDHADLLSPVGEVR